MANATHCQTTMHGDPTASSAAGPAGERQEQPAPIGRRSRADLHEQYIEALKRGVTLSS